MLSETTKACTVGLQHPDWMNLGLGPGGGSLWGLEAEGREFRVLKSNPLHLHGVGGQSFFKLRQLLKLLLSMTADSKTGWCSEFPLGQVVSLTGLLSNGWSGMCGSCQGNG